MAARLHSAMAVAAALACARGAEAPMPAQGRLEITVSLGRAAGGAFEPRAVAEVLRGDQTLQARIDAPAGTPLTLCSWGSSPNLRVRGSGCGLVSVLPVAPGPARLEAVVIAADGSEAIAERELMVADFALTARREGGVEISAGLLTRGALSFVTAPEVGGATYEWSIKGAAPEGPAAGPRLSFRAPPGGAVEVRCKVTTPDHGQVVLQRSFETVPPPVAAIEGPFEPSTPRIDRAEGVSPAGSVARVEKKAPVLDPPKRSRKEAAAVRSAKLEAAPAIGSFKAAPAIISEGGRAALQVSYSGGTADIDGAAAAPGELPVAPAKTTTYTLSVRNAAGAIERRQATVEVVPRPSVLRFAVEPLEVLPGEQAKLIAVFSGGTASLDPGAGAVISGKPVTIAPTSSTTWTLTVANAAGDKTTATATVQVAAPPAIKRFEVSPGRVIAPGSPVFITAVFENGSGTLQGIGPVQSGVPVKLAPRATQELVLSVQGEVGAPITAKARVEVAGTGARLLLLPLVSYGPSPAPLKDLRQSARQALLHQGITPVDDAQMEAFLARHRVRNTAGIDRETAVAAAQELGADGFVVTSVDSWQETEPLKLLITMRAVSATDSVDILWIDGAGHVGDESPGLFDLGVITDMNKLRSRTFEDAARSLAAFLTGKGPRATACPGGGRFDPRIALRSPRLDASRSYRVVVLPFANQGSRRRAGDLVAMDFVRNLSAVPGFTVVEPGRVWEELLRYRIILEGGVSLDLARVVTELLQADLVLTGSVREFFDAAAGGTPRVQFSAMLLDRVRNEVVWDANSWNRGDDGVFFFELGSVASAGQLACRMSRTAVDAMTRLRVVTPPANPASRAQEMRSAGPGPERRLAAQPLQNRADEKGDRR